MCNHTENGTLISYNSAEIAFLTWCVCTNFYCCCYLCLSLCVTIFESDVYQNFNYNHLNISDVIVFLYYFCNKRSSNNGGNKLKLLLLLLFYLLQLVSHFVEIKTKCQKRKEKLTEIRCVHSKWPI